MSKDTRKPRPRKDAEIEQQAIVASQSRSNRKTLLTIAAIVAAGLGLGIWLNYDHAGKSGEAQAQRAAGRTEVPEAELMQAGPLSEITLGNKDAKVTVVEYASMSCGHCANFHKTVFPDFKKKYVESGQVRFVFREFPLEPRAEAGAMLARCAGPDKFFAVLEVLFERQEQWAFVKGDPTQALQAIAKQLGMSEQAFKGCLENTKLRTDLAEVRKKGEQFGVNSTPTFFINGRKLTGAQDLAAFDKALEPLLK